MKILIVFDNNENSNPYVHTLTVALRKECIDVTCSVSEFWDNYQNYDIVHIQWPEYLIGEKRSYNDVINHINDVQTRCKIVVTCHNLTPHNTKNKVGGNVLDYVYNHCDVMIHLGQYSFEYFQHKLLQLIKHVVIPHHIYDNIYQFSIDKSEARNKLNIPLESNVLLCFGSFRDEKERQLVLRAFKRVGVPKKYLLLPGFYRKTIIRRNILKGLTALVKTLWYKIIGIHFQKRFLNDNETETYLCAADVLMIQRCSILNSGNLPLGFLAKKIVVGPNIGNVGIILNERENPTFNPNDNGSVIASIENGFALKDTDLPQRNYNYALEYWNVKLIAKKHIDIYHKLLYK